MLENKNRQVRPTAFRGPSPIMRQLREAAGLSANPTSPARPSTGAQQGSVSYPDTPEGSINRMYDASRDAQLARLKSAYDQNMSDARASYAKIDPAYQQKANDLATQYERNRRNFNIQAAGSGLNTGTASQAALAQNSAFQRDYGGLRVAQQNALDEAQRGMDQLTQGYNADVNAFTAQNEYERSRQLLAEQKEAYQNQLSMAANLAKYGDFSGYSGIYSDDQILQMQSNWIASNPDLAYRTGKIDANKYQKMTGKWPAGYTPPSSGGGGGGGGGGGSYNYSNAKGLTKSEIKQIQSALGVSSDGIWGPKTEAAYNAAKASGGAKPSGGLSQR